MRQHFKYAHNRQIAYGKEAFESLGRHALATDPGKSYATCCLVLERGNEPRADGVARRFAGNKKDERRLAFTRVSAHPVTVTPSTNEPAP